VLVDASRSTATGFASVMVSSMALGFRVRGFRADGNWGGSSSSSQGIPGMSLTFRKDTSCGGGGGLTCVRQLDADMLVAAVDTLLKLALLNLVNALVPVLVLDMELLQLPELDVNAERPPFLAGDTRPRGADCPRGGGEDCFRRRPLFHMGSGLEFNGEGAFKPMIKLVTLVAAMDMGALFSKETGSGVVPLLPNESFHLEVFLVTTGDGERGGKGSRRWEEEALLISRAKASTARVESASSVGEVGLEAEPLPFLAPLLRRLVVEVDREMPPWSMS
jgi:hypothetical protein